MDLIVNQFNLVLGTLAKKTVHFVLFVVEITVHDAEIAEYLIFSCLYSDLSIAKDDVVAVVGHASNDPFVIRVFLGVVLQVI